MGVTITLLQARSSMDCVEYRTCFQAECCLVRGTYYALSVYLRRRSNV